MIAVPTFHPAFILRSKGQETQGQAKFEETVIADVAKALRFRHRKPNWDERVIWERDANGRLKNLYPTLEEVFEFCRKTYEKRAYLTIDVETTGAEPLACQLICVGMANSAGDAICVPFLRQGGLPYWATQNEAQSAWNALRYMFADPTIQKSFHNGPFDTVVCHAFGMPVKGWTHDTMQAHHVVDGELPHGLAYVSSRYLELPYWKDDVKGDKAWLELDDQTLRSYNLRDCLATDRIRDPLLRDLARHDLLGLYWEEVQLAEIFARATIRGLEVDLERRDSTELDDKGEPKGLGPKMRKRRAEALAILQQIAGSADFNPRSVIHLRYLLFTQMRFPIVKETDKGAPSTDKNAMVLLGLHAKTDDQKRVLRALIDFRSADKIITGWVEGLPVLGDNRVHASWKLLPVTGRFASSPNAQNWNKAIKKIFRAGKGKKYVSIDLSQVELRIIAYYSGDKELLRMYAEDINVHTVNATLLFKRRCPSAAKDNINPQTEAYLREFCKKFYGEDYDSYPEVKDKAKWKSIRTLAKNFVFGDAYGAMAETLYEVIRAKRDPDTNELLFPDVTLAEIEAMQTKWHKLHPDIPRWWKKQQNDTVKNKHFRCPISGRIQWYRGGFKQNEMLNRPVQAAGASWINRQTITIDRDMQAQCPPGTAVLVSIVHDALTAEVDEQYVPIVKKIFETRLCEEVPMNGFSGVRLPADAATVGDYMDEV